MQKPEYKIMSKVEDSHFWYRGMRKITQSVLDRFIDKKNNLILDAGCGTGANLFFLKRYGKVVGIDISKEAVRLCRLKGLKSVKTGSINNLPFSDNSFELVTCFDVLGQNGVDEKKALSEFYRVLKPNGILFIRVAAYPFLYSLHDRVCHTKKRFYKKDFKKIFVESHFSILKLSYLNMFLFPAIAIRRIIFKNYSRQQSDVFQVSGLLNDFLLLPLLVESILIKFFNFPFGLSLMALVKSKKMHNKENFYGNKK